MSGPGGEQERAGSAFGALRQFARRPEPEERCAVCSAAIGSGHPHLLELSSRKMVCSCGACAILFDNRGQARYRRVPRRVRFLPDFQMDDSHWEGLMLPINMAFFFKSSPQDRMVAMYPSPAGATESLLALDAWEEIARGNPLLQEMEPDVEALLANRLGYSRGFTSAEYYLSPIDECYKLVGLIRTHWRGLSGGTEVWQEMARFFAGLKAKSEPGGGDPLPNLSFAVEKATAVPFAVSPVLALQLKVTNANPAETIHTVVLRCQVQIEVTRRRYTARDQEQLRDLFGEPERWGQTLKNMLWIHANAVVPQFTGSATVDLQLPCTFDFNVAATKYFHGLEDGEIPLCLMFSGTVFYADDAGLLRVAPISWDKEAKFRLPVKIWKDMMDLYYPNSAWICLRRDVFDRLHQFKMHCGIPTWEQTLEKMLGAVEETTPS